MFFSFARVLTRLMLVFCLLLGMAWEVSAAPVIDSATLESKNEFARLTLTSGERLVYRLAKVRDGKVLLLTLVGVPVSQALNDLNAQVLADDRFFRAVRFEDTSEGNVRLAFDLKTGIQKPITRSFRVKDGSGHRLTIDIHPAEPAPLNTRASVSANPSGAVNLQKLTADSPAPGPFTGVLRSVLQAANQGNQSGDYSQLYAQLSPSVQSKVRPDQLAQALKGFRDRSIDLSAVSDLEPILFRPPWEDSQGLTNLNGYFPTKPLAVRFVIALKQMSEGWRIEVLNLDTPNPEDLAAEIKRVPTPETLVKPVQNSPKAKAQPAFESPYLDWSTDPPTTSKW